MPLVALDNSWAICMPKKTGSHSLISMLAPSTLGVQGTNYATMLGDWHGGNWDGTGKRILIVRNPYERLTSMYWYSQYQSEGWLLQGGTCDSWISNFREEYQKTKRSYKEWVQTQSELAVEFQPDKVFRLEDGLESVMKEIGIKTLPIIYRNVTGDAKKVKLSFQETFSDCSQNLLNFIDLWCLADIENYYDYLLR